MTDNKAKELEKIHALMHQPSYVVIYPETEMENGYKVAQRILEYAEQLAQERVNDYIEPHLEYCQESNGLSYCKNCGLKPQEKK